MSKAKKGINKSDEWKNKISKSMIGKNSKKVIDNRTGIIYDSITEASKILNISRAYLSQQLLGVYKNNTNYEFYVESPQ